MVVIRIVPFERCVKKERGGKEEGEIDGEGGGSCVREGHKWKGGGILTGVYRFIALTSASFSTHCSEPVCHAPPTTTFLLLPSPHWSALNRGERLGEGGQREKTDSFSLDVLQCQARRDAFKDEEGVNVVGRMTELL